MADKYYKNDIGTQIIVDIGTDITGATNTKLLVEKPGGEEVEWTAAVYNSNYLLYTTIAGDFIPGIFKLNASLTLGGWSGRGETATFEVFDEFE